VEPRQRFVQPFLTSGRPTVTISALFHNTCSLFYIWSQECQCN